MCVANSRLSEYLYHGIRLSREESGAEKYHEIAIIMSVLRQVNRVKIRFVQWSTPTHRKTETMDNETQVLLLEFHRNTISDIKSMIMTPDDYGRISTEYLFSLFDLEKRIFNKLINATNKV